MNIVKTFTFQYSIRRVLVKIASFPLEDRPLLRVAYKKDIYTTSRLGTVSELYKNFVIFREDGVEGSTFVSYIHKISSLEILGE